MEKKEEDFEIVFKKYYQRLCFYARKFIDDDSVAEDIVQDVFSNLWERKYMIELEIELRAFLSRSVHNRCLNHLQHKLMASKHHERIIHELKIMELEYSKSSNAYEPSLFELEIKIEKAFESLPPQCRNVFEMSRLKGLKNREIAENLQISIKMVERHISKALVILREYLKDYLSVILVFINIFK